MSEGKLVRMANDIAAFFQAYPPDEATAGIHDHIRSFWTPKMRDQLRTAAAAGTPGMNPLVIRAMSEMPHARNPADKEAAGPAEVGEIGASDAG